MESIRSELPEYLQELMTLMIIRTQRLLKEPATYSAKDVDHPMLKKIIQLEQKIPALALKNTVWKLINPRIDISDVLNLGLKN
jgi:hypothetical protein